MKYLTKLIAAIMLASTSAGAMMAEEQTDTVNVLERAKNVTVVKTGNLTEVKATVNNDGEDEIFTYQVRVENKKPETEDEYPDSWGIDVAFMKFPTSDEVIGKKKIRRNFIVLKDVFWGWRCNYNDKAHVKNGWELGARDLIGVSWSRYGKNSPKFTIGLGMKCTMLYSQDGYMYSKIGDKVVSFPVEVGEVEHSSICSGSWLIPVSISQPLGKECDLTIGGVMNFNYYTEASVTLRNGNDKFKVNYKGMQQNLFTADVYAALNVYGLGVYASWSPMKMFDKRFGPELKAWSIGVTLFY